MSEIAAIAAWLRQREGETDTAWIARLRDVLGREPGSLPDDAKADRLGERLWERFKARRTAAEGEP